MKLVVLSLLLFFSVQAFSTVAFEHSETDWGGDFFLIVVAIMFVTVFIGLFASVFSKTDKIGTFILAFVLSWLLVIIWVIVQLCG